MADVQVIRSLDNNAYGLDEEAVIALQGSTFRPGLRNGELLNGTENPRFKQAWEMADPDSFRPMIIDRRSAARRTATAAE